MSKIISAINTILLIAQAVIAVTIIKSCDTIPVHWNITGEIDSYGSPCNIIFFADTGCRIMGLDNIRNPASAIHQSPAISEK
ncbi:MAG: DUF1648 domain-containing protein [Duncaniella sp.]|nr:DUF1648 domain-containing protein [Duncaniella sp.]